jgi:phosphoribosylanthranilate isomerase
LKRTRIKICGITRTEDAAAAVEAGADAIGLVFWEPSSRAVSLHQAIEICREVSAFVTVVALTVNAERDFIQRLLSELSVDLLQFHGDESAEQCQQYDHPYIKALRMRPELQLEQELINFSSAKGILLDAYRKGIPGGTGESFNWQLIAPAYRQQIILAGGLNPDNVAQAVNEVRPYAVDVSGGVEESPGVKDAHKIQQFISAAMQADRRQ